MKKTIFVNIETDAYQHKLPPHEEKVVLIDYEPSTKVFSHFYDHCRSTVLHMVRVQPFHLLNIPYLSLLWFALKPSLTDS